MRVSLSTIKARLTRLGRHMLIDSRIRYWGLILIISVFTINTLVQSIGIPIFEGSDEQRHYAYARYLVNNRALPPRTRPTEILEYSVYGIMQEAGQPPLYYIPVALMTALVPNADDTAAYVVENQFSTKVNFGIEFDNHNWFLHANESNFPYQGVALAVRLGRLVSVLAGIFTLLGVYRIARACIPEQPALALLATALIASVPGFIFIYSVITNDVAVILFTTLSLWIAVRIVREGSTIRLALIGGLFAGLATLSKISGIWAIGIICLAFLLSMLAHRRTKPARPYLQAIGYSMMVWLLTTGWWFVWGLLQGGDPLGVATHSPRAIPISFPGSTFEDFLAWDHTMWYGVAWNMLWGPSWIITLCHLIYLPAFISPMAIIAYAHKDEMAIGTRISGITIQAILLTVAILLALSGGLYWYIGLGWRMGRLVFPALVCASVFAAMGWGWLINIPRASSTRPGIPIVLITVLALTGQTVAIYSGYYTLRALSSRPRLAADTPGVIATDITYMDPVDHETPVAKLIGYRIHDQENVSLDQPYLYMDLCWKSTGYTRQSFPYELELIGPDQNVMGFRRSYHGLGGYPMAAWRNGEAFCDPATIIITETIQSSFVYTMTTSLFVPESNNNGVVSLLPSLNGNQRAATVQDRVSIATVQLGQ